MNGNPVLTLVIQGGHHPLVCSEAALERCESL